MIFCDLTENDFNNGSLTITWNEKKQINIDLNICFKLLMRYLNPQKHFIIIESTNFDLTTQGAISILFSLHELTYMIHSWTN